MKSIRIGLGIVGALAATVLAAGPALASDKTPCGTGMVCASDPASVAAALQALGYKAQIDKDNQGDPSVSSAADGYDYDILFYGCDNHTKCDSLQLRLTFSPYDIHTDELANEWNRGHRFLRAEVRDDKRMAFNYDVTTIGGLNKANFGDVIAWWSSMLGEVDKFFREHPAGKRIDTPAPARPAAPSRPAPSNPAATSPTAA